MIFDATKALHCMKIKLEMIDVKREKKLITTGILWDDGNGIEVVVCSFIFNFLLRIKSLICGYDEASYYSSFSTLITIFHENQKRRKKMRNKGNK